MAFRFLSTAKEIISWSWRDTELFHSFERFCGSGWSYWTPCAWLFSFCFFYPGIFFLPSQWAHGLIITSLLHHNYVVTSFWRSNCIMRPLKCEFLNMMTSSNANIFRVTSSLCGEFTGNQWIPPQRPVPRNFNVFFDLCLNKHLSIQSWGWWFETSWCSLWRHCNGNHPHVYIAGGMRIMRYSDNFS